MTATGVGPAEQQDFPWESIPSEELGEASQGQLQEFRQDLESSQEAGALIIRPELFAEDITDEKPVNTQLIRNIDKMVNQGTGRLYLSPEFAWLGDSEITRFSVVRTAGAETSAHGVFFGLLSNSEGDRVLPVAIKPCRTKPAKAYADWLNNSLIAQTGQDHFTPVGFMIGAETNYSITELKQGAETLDNSEWGAVLMDEQNPAYQGQRALLKKLGGVLSVLHANNIFHNDPQFKNLVNDVAGHVFLIDWESSSFYSDNAPQEVLVTKAAHDLRVLFGSMARSKEDKGVGLLSGLGPWMQWQHFKEYIFNPYMDAYLAARPGEASFNRLAEVEELTRDYILGNGLKTSLRRIRQTA